jgi:hypothetical protein
VDRTAFLTSSPTSNMPSACADWSIFLAAGPYEWLPVGKARPPASAA